jgi:hypothetical protein
VPQSRFGCGGEERGPFRASAGNRTPVLQSVACFCTDCAVTLQAITEVQLFKIISKLFSDAAGVSRRR